MTGEVVARFVFVCLFFWRTPSLFSLPSCACADREVNVVLVGIVQKQYSIQEFSSSVVRAHAAATAACLHILQKHTESVWHVRQFVFSSLSVCVCVLFFFFSPSACFIPSFLRQVLAAAAVAAAVAAAALWSLAMC